MPRSSSWLLAACLGLILLLVVVLAVLLQWRTAEHRRTAARVLHDYAQFAADEYARRVQQRLDARFSPVLQELARAGGDRGALPDTAALLRQAGDRTRQLLGQANGFLVLEDDRLEATPEAPVWASDALRAHAPEYQKDWYLAVGWPSDSTAQVLAYTVRQSDDGHLRAWGIVLPTMTIGSVLEEALRRGPLLPSSLTGGRPIDSLASVTVRAPSGAPLFRTQAEYEAQFQAERVLTGALGGIAMQVTLRPSTAPLLVIGGLPPSPLPLVLGVLALTAALALVAVYQLRQERRLAGLRADFVSAASHELRTPLAQIRLFAETLQLGRVRSESEQNRALAIIGQESRRLSHLVDNLLHVARSDGRALGVTLIRLRLDEVAREVVEAFTPLAESRRATVRIEAPGPVWVLGDRGAISQVLLNLLDNAVKYGPVGGVVIVRVDVHQRPEPGVVHLKVEDQGPGIPPETRERVFDRFERLDRDRDSAVGGSGIGLAIVRELVTLMDGRVCVEEGRGGGALLLVELPAG